MRKRIILITCIFIIVYVVTIFEQFSTFDKISQATLHGMFLTFREQRHRFVIELNEYPLFLDDNVLLSKKLTEFMYREHISRLIITKGNYIHTLAYMTGSSQIEITHHLSSLIRTHDSKNIAQVALIIYPTNSYIRYRYVYDQYIIYAFIDFDMATQLQYINKHLFIIRLDCVHSVPERRVLGAIL